MAKHRHVIIGAGRIGAGYQWGDLEYTHAGASQALKDRIELVGFIEPDNDRAVSAKLRWHVPVYEDLPSGLDALKPDIVSVCVQPDNQIYATGACIDRREFIKGMWCEKPFMRGPIRMPFPTQVNYLRRGDKFHRKHADELANSRLIVYGKDDIHTRCHFEDLARWWGSELVYRPFNGPCSYILEDDEEDRDYFFDNGGLYGREGDCMKAMLGNLLDHVDNGTPLWSPAL